MAVRLAIHNKCGGCLIISRERRISSERADVAAQRRLTSTLDPKHFSHASSLLGHDADVFIVLPVLLFPPALLFIISLD
jgi:hypothetical protein